MSSYGEERDLEVGSVLEFIKSHSDIQTTLDVGAHNTYSTYAARLKKLVKTAYGVDIVPDPLTARILDKYFIGNVTESKLRLPTADLVFSISSIEHAGISTYKLPDMASIRLERTKMFKRMYELANKYLIVTCPFGLEMFMPGQYANVTAEDLANFSKISGQKLDLSVEFYFRSDHSSGFARIPYNEACNVAFDPNIGLTRCIAIIKVAKNV